MKKFQPVHPFEYDRLYGDERYSLQNMLLKQVNMPTALLPGKDLAWETWSDHEREAWNQAWPLLKIEGGGDAALHMVSDENFLAFASKLVSTLAEREIKVTGACVIRFTNAMSGYPCYRLNAVVVAPENAAREYGVPYLPFKRETYNQFHRRMMGQFEQEGAIFRDDE